jgi:hypothetical protein
LRKPVVPFTVVLLLLAVFAVPWLNQVHAASGEVCLAGPGATNCPSSPPLLSGSVGSQLRVAVLIQNSGALDGFGISLLTNYTILRPVGVSLTGSVLLGNPVVIWECLSGVLIQGSSCPSTDTIDTISLAAFSETGQPLTTTPTTGLLFTAIYNVTASASDTLIGFQTGCTDTSVSDTCVTITNGTANPVPESLQAATVTTSAGPDFVMIADPTTITVPLAGSASSTLDITSVNNFQGTITLSTYTPALGLTVNLSTASISLIANQTASATITVSTPTSQFAGSDLLYVTGTNGTLSHTIIILVDVPDFTLSLSPSVLGLGQGGSADTTLTVSSANSFNGTISFITTTSLPSLRVSPVSFNVTVSPGGTATTVLTISTSNATTIGSYKVVITGHNGALTRSAAVTVTVVSAPPSQFAIDGSNGEGCPNTTSSCSVTLTTQHSSDIIIAFATEALDLETSCTFNVSDTANMLWTPRSAVIFSSDHREQLQEFWAKSPSPLVSDTVSDSIFGCGDNYNNIMVFGISGANYNNPFDPNLGLPSLAQGTGGNTTVQVSTSNPDDMVFAAVLHGNIAAFPSAPPGFAIITPPGTNAVEYETVNTTLTNSTVSFIDPAVGPWVSVADAVEAASTTPGFTISPNPVNIDIAPLNSATTTIALSSQNNFTGTVNLSVPVPPSGLAVAITPSVLLVSPNATSHSTVTITSTETASGTFDLYIQGTSGPITESVLFLITIKPAPLPNFTVSGPSLVIVTAGGSTNSTVTVSSLDNFTGLVTLTPDVIPTLTNGPVMTLSPIQLSISSKTTGFSTLTVTTTTSTPTGPYNYTITGMAAVGNATIDQIFIGQLLVEGPPLPDFTMSVTNFTNSSIGIRAGQSATETIRLVSVNGFSGSISLFASLTIIPVGLTGASASVSPSTVTLSSNGTATATLTINAGFPPYTPASFTVTVTGASGAVSHSISVDVTILPPPPGFDISLENSLTMIAGENQTASIDLEATEGFSGNVSLTVAISPIRVNGPLVSVDPSLVFINQYGIIYFPSSTLTISTSSITPPGNYTVTVTGTSGTLTHAATLSLLVQPPPTITLSQSSGVIGATVTLAGIGFPSAPQELYSSPITIEVTFDDQFLGYITTSNGAFSFTFNVPLAQAGLHHVKAISEYPFLIATTAFQVLPPPVALMINLTSGTLYFPGDTASFYILVTQNGQPANITSLQLTVQIMKPNGAIQKLTARLITTGVYTATYLIPRASSLGTYAIIVTAQVPATANTSTLTSFEVKPTWLQSNGTNLAAGATVAGLVGLVGLAWQQGFFKKKRDDKSFDWNNWNGSSAKPQL